MEKAKKQKIAEELKAFCDKKGSQNKAVTALGVSSATISQILNQNWENINDDMWRTIASQVGGNDWQLVETDNFQNMEKVFTMAKEESLAIGVVCPAGNGKSAKAKTYAQDNENTFVVSCNEYWNRPHFLQALLTEMGVDPSGMQTGEMVAQVVKIAKKTERPLIILDEADKLRDQLLHFFITFYNALEGKCGFALLSTQYLEKRIKNGIALNKKGYQEIFSRLGGAFVNLSSINYTDAVQICQANGVTEAKIIKEIFEDGNNDIRRIARKITAYKRDRANKK